jgi:hypothetical protein
LLAELETESPPDLFATVRERGEALELEAVVAAAQERSQARDLEATVAELLAQLADPVR